MGGSCWLVSRSGQWVLQVGESVELVGPAGRSVSRVSGSCRLVSWSGQWVLPVGRSALVRLVGLPRWVGLASWLGWSGLFDWPVGSVGSVGWSVSQSVSWWVLRCVAAVRALRRDNTRAPESGSQRAKRAAGNGQRCVAVVRASRAATTRALGSVSRNR